ncbi:MAG: phytanoyl-CoA dioxygenase family protein [Planctomycetota bacterium]
MATDSIASAAAVDRTRYAEEVAENGFAIVNDVISDRRVAELRGAIASLPESEEVRRRTNVYGVRNLLEVLPEAAVLAAEPAIRSLVTPVLGDDCFAVRATFFDKAPGANWNLRWHQDGVIAVRDRVETPGFTAWAQKAQTWQVRPPAGVLGSMLAIRVHLDDCPAANGALRVLAGSHRQWWPREELDTAKQRHPQRVCEARAGGVLAMRPLLLHASSAAEAPAHRRVIHIEYARDELPGKLEWRSRIAG